MDNKEGLPGPEPSCDRYNPLVSGKTPGLTGQQVVPQQETGSEETAARANVSGYGMGVERQHPMSLDSSTEIPDSPPISFQLPASPPPFEKICAPSQAPTSDSGCLGHLSYDQFRDLCKQHRYHRKDATEGAETRLTSMQGRKGMLHSGCA